MTMNFENHTKDDGCIKCGSTENMENHHVVPQRVGGSDDQSNLAPLCHRCHSFVTEYFTWIPGLSEEEHRQLFERFASTGLPVEYDFALFGMITAYESLDEQDDESIDFDDAIEGYKQIIDNGLKIFVWEKIDRETDGEFGEIVDGGLEQHILKEHERRKAEQAKARANDD